MNQKSLLICRLSIGLIQGIWLSYLQEAAFDKFWPETNGYIFVPLLTVGIFVPIIAISGLGNLRLRILLIWLGLASVLCAALGFYDSNRMLVGATGFVIVPLAAILFILHTLVVSGETDRRWIATYPTHFNVAWKHAVQIILADLFVGVFWVILALGAALFSLVKVTFFVTLIINPKFAIPGDNGRLGLRFATHRCPHRTGARHTHAFADVTVMVAAGDGSFSGRVPSGAALHRA